MASKILLQPDNKFIVAGTTYDGYGDISKFAFVRYLPSGQIDETFGINGLIFTPLYNPWLNDAIFQPDGKIVAGGTVLLGHIQEFLNLHWFDTFPYLQLA